MKLISHGRFEELPHAFDWLEKFDHGNTALHYAAGYGFFNFIPKKILNEKNLSIENSSGINVVTQSYNQGHIATIPEDFRHLAKGYSTDLILEAIKHKSLADLPAWISRPEFLIQTDGKTDNSQTLLHMIAAAGLLGQLPSNLLFSHHLATTDKNGNTVLHTLLQNHQGHTAPASCFNDASLLQIKNNKGENVFQIAAVSPNLGGIPITKFTKDVLTTECTDGRNIADLVDENGNTSILPPKLRNFSIQRAKEQLKECFLRDFVHANELYQKMYAHVLKEEHFALLLREFVQKWSTQICDTDLDNEQADAVAQLGTHIQVTARAGSGKTRTLVARAIFHIKHCGINPRSILILAFNRKAVAEIRARFAKCLDEGNRPHVLTFHSLAWRIVRPSEELLYDEEGSDEKKRLSQLIQEIIRAQLRDGTLEADLKDLMRINWEDSLSRIIAKGFDLSEDEFVELRQRMHDATLDGRRVETEAHKCIGDFLLQNGLDYSYRPTIWRSYTPAFVHTTAASQRIVIEASGKRKEDAQASHSFWQSDRASSSQRIILDSNALASRKSLVFRLRDEFKQLGVNLVPLSKEALWEKIRDKVIDGFTKSVQSFISRCQKECLWPELLSNRIEAYRDPTDLQSKFWSLALRIFQLYEGKLGASMTDFDRLMLEAAERISGGETAFSSQAGKANIRSLNHILIDEFQDFSLLFHKLRSAMVKVNPDALYFCVGDDWQAINRFAGSDLRYFTSFREQFQPSQKLEITTNYRSASSIVEAGNRVMSGQGIPSKPRQNAPHGKILMARSATDAELSPGEESASDRFGQLAVDILRLAQMPGMPLHKEADAIPPINHFENPKLTVLSRTTSLPTPKGMRTVEQWQTGLRKFLPEYCRDRIEFSTVHGYKGREATAVILIEPEVYPLIHPDAVLAAIFGDTYESLVGDERRLFYVGVTRAEETLVLLQTNPEARIDFIDTSRLESIDINRLESNLLMGDEVIVSLRNAPSVRNLEGAGTMPLKESLKNPAAGFAWKREQGAWTRRFPIEEMHDAPSFQEFLLHQPWISDADQVLAALTGDQVSVEFLITKGQIQRVGATFSESEEEELASLHDEHGIIVTHLLEYLYLELGLPWPEFGYERTDANGVCDGSLITVAWPDQKVGIAFPGDFIEGLEENDWIVHHLDSIDRDRLASDLSPRLVQQEPKGPKKGYTQDSKISFRSDSIQHAPAQRDVETPPEEESYCIQLAGVTYEGRRTAIATIRSGDPVTLLRCQEHPKDSNAIEVFSADSLSLGYVPAILASKLASQIDCLGGQLQGRVAEVTNATAHGHLSVSIEFRVPNFPV